MDSTTRALKIFVRAAGLFLLIVVVTSIGLRVVGREAEIRDCTESEAVVSVTGCSSSRNSLVCSIETTKRIFRTDVTNWPSNYLSKGDEIFWCTRDVQWGATHPVNCKDGRCSY